jgi:hypothetical protein
MLTFDEATHTYRYDGHPIPSVTQILKPLADFSSVPKEILEAKRKLGQDVHLATELEDNGTLDEATVDAKVLPYLQAWRKFKEERGFLVLEAETKVCSVPHQFAGTLDRIGAMDQHDWLLDIKTSYEIHPAVGPQTAAYKEARGLEHLRRAVVRLGPDGEYEFKELTSPRDWVAFQACKLIHRFKMEHKIV